MSSHSGTALAATAPMSQEAPVGAVPAPWLVQVEEDPGNPYLWDLWAKVLSTLGRKEASLSVRWESARGFPEDSVLRNSLAETLREHGRMLLAEHLLRETMRDFPNDEVFRSRLDELSSSTERQENRGAETDVATEDRLAASGQAEEEVIGGDISGRP